jgi:hypothetical protein
VDVWDVGSICEFQTFWRPSKAMILKCHLAPMSTHAAVQTLAASVMDFEKAAASLFL